MLASRCAEGPFALLVDEAHALSPEIGGRLLDASQSIRRMGAPFLLILAGTPGIQQALQGMGTTFWERSLRVPVGRLKPGEDRDALMKPLKDSGCSTDADALARLLDAASLYPYFIQEVGAATVTTLNARGAKHIDTAVADQALAAFSSIETAFYGSRADELDDAGLLPYAAALAQLFAGEDRSGVPRRGVGHAGRLLRTARGGSGRSTGAPGAGRPGRGVDARRRLRARHSILAGAFGRMRRLNEPAWIIEQRGDTELKFRDSLTEMDSRFRGNDGQTATASVKVTCLAEMTSFPRKRESIA